jgi:hypothetical protein
MYFAESTRTQYFEAPQFFVPVAGITVCQAAKLLMRDLTRERPNMRGSNSIRLASNTLKTKLSSFGSKLPN